MGWEWKLVRRSLGKRPFTRPSRWKENTIKINFREIGLEFEVEESGSRSCPMAGYGIRGVETSGSVTRESVKLLLKIGFEMNDESMDQLIMWEF